MRKFTICIAAVCMLAACDKPATQQVTPQNNNQSEQVTSNPVYGKWAYVHDTTRTFTVDSIVTGKAYITFHYRIDAPQNGDISLVYDAQQTADTIFCTISTIYPNIHFNEDGEKGLAAEHLRNTQQGQLMPIKKVN